MFPTASEPAKKAKTVFAADSRINDSRSKSEILELMQLTAPQDVYEEKGVSYYGLTLGEE